MNVLFAKYNRERLPQYQIETAIISSDNGLIARKKALTPVSIAHINQIYINYSLLRETYPTLNLSEAKLEGDSLFLSYITGSYYDNLVIESIINEDRTSLHALLDLFVAFLDRLSVKKDIFISDEAFEKVFATSLSLQETKVLNIANIDLTFDNLVYDADHSIVVIDYEWVFEFAIPAEFILFRSINELNAKYYDYLNGEFSIEFIFEYVGITKEKVELYNNLEQGFQKYVFGEEREYQIANKYLKKSTSFVDMQVQTRQMSEAIEFLKIDNSKLQAQVIEINAAFQELQMENKDLSSETKKVNAKLQEEVQNHKAHIETLLDQERKLQRIEGSGGYRFLLKYYKLRDSVIPVNSRRRLFLKLLVMLVRKPKQFTQRLRVENFKKFFKYLKTDSSSLLGDRVESYLQKFDNSQERKIELAIVEDYSEKLIFKNVENPLVSVIIPAYNQWAYTYSCLKSILKHTTDTPYEIIIADDMSTDETGNIAKYVENIRVIRDGSNRGFLLNCNNAAQYAKGKYVLFLNNDTNVQENWLKYLVDLVENDVTIGMVGSKLVYPDGKLQEAGGIIWNDASGWNYGRLDDPNKPEYNYVKEVDYISGAAIMIRTDLWNEIGGFDERYVPAYYEDSDLAFEVRKHGYKVVLQPKSVVVHFEGVSHGTDTGSGIKSYQVNNRAKFIEKWSNILEHEHFENAVNVFSARDRSKDKKTILFIDHYVPHYDKDAGSRTTFLYLKLFIEMGLNVKFLGDNFFKHEPYTSELEQFGVEVLYGKYYRDNYEKWMKNNADKIHYVYLNRPHISIKYIDFLKKHTKAKIIYYGHDLHYVREKKRYELEGKIEYLKSSDHWKNIEFDLFSKSDKIITLSEAEEKLISLNFPNKKVNVFPVFYFDKVEMLSYISGQREGLLFVGGFSHSPNVDGIKWFCSRVFPLVIKQIPSIKLSVVGSNPPQEILNLQSSSIDIKGFVSDDVLNELYSKSKVIIVPLRYGAGVKGKTIEAMFHQVPIVSTSFGTEGLTNIESIIPSVDDPVEFAQNIIDMYSNTLLLEEVQRKYYDYINKYFTKKSAKEIMGNILEG
ncbi:glycosyltransferase [Paenibacillus eucommiae]|uniref:GT2 family glycosyltransferase n=1 Tax=Paenibacillus eucommiae TaxID=1355755 RepID=A0ABS4IU90_9BACL|nr:glycosyltransferase [Paenibacillus eucommiae]MBP1991148.1 GT2 family glycosyltransferase [Paenibacillus eucommiae]